jgi:hypothetical protein
LNQFDRIDQPGDPQGGANPLSVAPLAPGDCRKVSPAPLISISDFNPNWNPAENKDSDRK